MACAADKVANIKAGKEPEAPTAMVSPELAPAFLSRDTISPAKFGFVLVLFASRLPRDVVMGEDFTPINPVPFTSEEGSIVRFFAFRHSLRAPIARDIIREAEIISSLRALASREGMICARRKNTRLRKKSPNRNRFFRVFIISSNLSGLFR